MIAEPKDVKSDAGEKGKAKASSTERLRSHDVVKKAVGGRGVEG